MFDIKKMVLVCGLSVAMAALGGCSMMQGENTGGRSAGRALDDKDLTMAVEHKLKEEPVYKFSDVDVKTFSGVVQLSGFVSTEEQKQRAGELAEHVDGVAKVVNNITLKPSNMAPTGRTDDVNEGPQHP